MANKLGNTFQLDIAGGAGVLRDMSANLVRRTCNAIASRADMIYRSKHPNSEGRFEKEYYVGTTLSPKSTPRYNGSVEFTGSRNPEYFADAVKALKSARSAGKVE